jgi:hypothetical protein
MADMNIEIIITFIRSHLRIIDRYDLTAYKKVITFIMLFTIFLIFIMIMSNTSQSIPPKAVTNVTIRANISPADMFYPHIAIIVDFRKLDHIIAVVHNVNHHIPSSWPIQIFHGKENEHFIRNSTLAPLIATGKVFLTLLEEVYGRERTDTLFTSPVFWKRIRGEKVLTFQIDSAMCSNSPHKVTDFLQYDYVGAPWDLSFFLFDKQYRVGNGGFSLRTRSKVLTLLALVPYDPKLPEDVFYAQNMHRVNGSIPSIEIAKTFSVESMYYERPVGVHRFPWHCQFRADIAKTCPESMLAMPDVCH